MPPRRSAVNEQRRERAKSRILGAAHALFTERGYDATTLDAVAEAAGKPGAEMRGLDPQDLVGATRRIGLAEHPLPVLAHEIEIVSANRPGR